MYSVSTAIMELEYLDNNIHILNVFNLTKNIAVITDKA